MYYARRNYIGYIGVSKQPVVPPGRFTAGIRGSVYMLHPQQEAPAKKIPPHPRNA